MRQTVKHVVLPVFVAIVAASCAGRQADSTSPGIRQDLSGDQSISGKWATTAIGPVYRESMTLTQTGTHVTGTGQYAIEAGRQGPTTIEGDWVAGTLTLAIKRDYGQLEAFSGTLTDATHLVGALVIDGNKQEFTLEKQR